MRGLPSSSLKPGVSLAFFLFQVIFTATLVCFPAAAQQSASAVVAAPHPLIIDALDESRRMVLKGNTHPLAKRQFDLGTAPASLPMERMLLVLKRSTEQETALRKLLDDQQDKHSPQYHKWLTPEQFGAQFGPSDADMQTITGWLQSHGFQVGKTKGRTVLEFSGSASQVQEAFQTSIHKYIVNGEQHWANASDPSIPAALVPGVAGIKTLHNFLKKPMVHIAVKSIPAKLDDKGHPEFTGSDGSHALTPDDYRTIYNSSASTVTGAGVTIAVVGRSNLFSQGQDITDFQNVLGTTNSFQIVVNGPDPGDVGGSEELEATLDASWAGAVAPNADVRFVVSGSTNDTDGIDLSELYIIENNLGAIMTESFGTCEAGVTSADAQGVSALAEQAAAQGITYMVSAGDTGAEGCDDLSETTAVGGISVNVLASTPFTVALGGTMFNEHGQDATYWSTTNSNTLGSALSYIPEDVWNETCTTQCQQGQPPLAAGSGGASIYFTPKPSWQSLVTNGDTVRDIPDVSLTAAGHDPYLLCIEGSCVPDAQGNISFAGVAGTSAATPSFASIMALVDQSQGGPQGNANYVLYPLALAQQTAKTACDASNTTTPPNGSCVFNDVTSGNNSVPGEVGYPTGVYSAAAGYDLASGLGSVNVANLITAWKNATFNATTTTLTLNGVTTPITLSHGLSVAVAGTVTSNSSTPAGNVALIAATGPSLSDATGVAMFALGSGGAISGSTSFLPGGSYMVHAHYAGNGTFAASDSAGVQVTVSPEASKIALSGFDPNNNPITSGNNTFPFGSVIFVRADVSPGTSGIGVPTGSVTFSDTFGAIPTSNPQLTPPVSVPNPSPLNSQGNTSIGDGIVSFDAGNHSITATYSGDSSFNPIPTAQGNVSFTIQPGFAGVSGPTDVSISAPGSSGTTTIGIIASSNFTTSITFTCSGLPAEATCAAASAKGQGPTSVVNTSISITTTAAHTTMLRSGGQRFYYAALLAGGLPLAGVLVLGNSQRRRRSIFFASMMLITLLILVPACGGGSSSSRHVQDPGTPAGTYNVTVTATAGSLSEQGSFNLTVQ